jgi:amino acid adenylation domain-containing protein
VIASLQAPPIVHRDGVGPEPPAEQVAEGGTFALTERQKLFWVERKLFPGIPLHNNALIVDLKGHLDVPRLEAAYRRMVADLDCMRLFVDESAPRQWVVDAEPPAVEHVDLSDSPDKLAAWMGEHSTHVFTFPGWLFRPSIVRLGQDRHVFFLLLHHIGTDGVSAMRLVDYLADLYEGKEPSPGPSFREYAVFEAAYRTSPKYRRDAEYWSAKIGKGVPPLRFYGLPRHGQGVAIEQIWYDAGAERRARFDEMLGRESYRLFTPAMSRLAGLATLLFAFIHRVTENRELVIATPVHNRAARFEKTFGLMMEQTFLKVEIDEGETFASLYQKVRRDLLKTFGHAQYCANERGLDFVLLNMLTHRTGKFAGLDCDVRVQGALTLGGSHGIAGAPKGVIGVQIHDAEDAASFVVGFELHTATFPAARRTRLTEHFGRLLDAFLDDPSRAITGVDLLGDVERAELLRCARGPEPATPPFSLVERLEERCSRRPEKVAVIGPDEQLTYGGLCSRVNRLARRLTELGVGPGRCVAVSLPRGAAELTTLLAVLTAGGAYIPLDPAQPRERLRMIVEDAEPDLLVTWRGAPLANARTSWRAVFLEEELPGLSRFDDKPLHVAVSGDDLAYVLFTSGSTGRPKGVEITRRSLDNLLASMEKQPGLSDGDRLLAITTTMFDIAGVELFLPLCVGATVQIADRETAVDSRRLRATLERDPVTVLQATPATWRSLVEIGWSGDGRLRMITGGEALSRDLANQLLDRGGALWNGYGPTETTVYSTFARVERGGEIVIGNPIDRTQVYVVDSGGHLAPFGVIGELCIGGAGVARGYRGRPDLTEERFVRDRWGGGTDRIYRTGDLARLHDSGAFECLGRIDHQVKIRGYRIELGEIESVLRRVPGVGDIVVVSRPSAGGDPRLVGYYTGAAEGAALLERARAALPQYMHPSALVRLPALPLNSNGKVDRKALPEPEASQAVERVRVRPRTELEQRLCEIWQRALGIPEVGVTDDFFVLGGESLLAVKVFDAIHKAFGVDLPLSVLFEAPRIEVLARRLTELRSAGADTSSRSTLAAVIDGAGPDTRRPPKMERRRGTGPARQSLMQQRLGFLHKMETNVTAYNMPLAYRLRGTLDVQALERSLDGIVARHDVLRTTLVYEGGQGYQRVARELHAGLPVIDLSDVAAQEVALRDRLQKDADTPIDLEVGPLFRASLYRLGPDHHVFFFMPHHTIWDGSSFDTFIQELEIHYAAWRAGHPPDLAPLPFQYGDFAEWHHEWLRGSGHIARQTAYWKRKLAGELPPLDLPADRPRPAVRRGDGSLEILRLSDGEAQALRRVAHDSGATLYMTLLAAFFALLHRLSRQDDILVGTPVHGRSQPETEDLLGFFANTLVIRGDVSGSPTFRELLLRVRAACLEAFAHPDMPFEQLVRALDVPRDLSRTPIFQALFSYHNALAHLPALDGVEASLLDVMPSASHTDIALWVSERSTGVDVALTFSTELFEATSARRILAEYATLLASVAADADQRVSTIPILPEVETRRLSSWNATEEPFDRDARVDELVARRACAEPDAVAVLDEAGDALSYAGLEQRANRLARRLRALGVRRGARVGLLLERSPTMLVAMLAVLKAGAAYVPLDPAFPPARVAFMAQDARLAALLTVEKLAGTLPTGAPSLLLDRDAHVIDGESPEPLPPDSDAASPGDAAYVIYTSGSTGRPKGVQVPHRAVVNFLTTMAREPGLSERDVMVAVTTLSFDIAVLELYLPLTVGAKVVVASRETASDGAALLALLRRHRATVMQATPATWRILVDAGWSRDDQLKVLCGGEALPLDLARAMVERSPAVCNLYGPTETTVWSTRWSVPADASQVLIGRPIGNTRCYVLDAQQRHVPIGVPGELYIAGDCVALGYLDRPELTQERFLPDPFAPAGQRMYRTGDVVRWRDSGDIEYIGRNDHQVKLRGYRIELGEIESRMLEHPDIHQAVAVVREFHPGDSRLVAYFTVPPGRTVTGTDLRKMLRSSLPDYMVPQAFVELEGLPLTPNGKIDRKALPAPFDGARPEAVALPPRTDNERAVAEVWRDLLGRTDMSIHDNFFEIGGDSLLVLQAIARIEQRTGVRIGPRAFVVDTLEQLAAQLPVASASDDPAPKKSATRENGLSLIERLKRRFFG